MVARQPWIVQILANYDAEEALVLSSNHLPNRSRPRAVSFPTSLCLCRGAACISLAGAGRLGPAAAADAASVGGRLRRRERTRDAAAAQKGCATKLQPCCHCWRVELKVAHEMAACSTHYLGRAAAAVSANFP
jgi:hypothetical protein